MAKIVDPTAGYMPLPLKFKRSNAGPIDTTMLWTDEAAMRSYAESTTGTSYVGQVLTLVNTSGVQTFVVKNVAGTLEKLPLESEISGSIGPITGSVEALSQSVSSLFSSVESISDNIATLSGSVESVAGDVASVSGSVEEVSGNSKTTDDALAGRISGLDGELRVAISSASDMAYSMAVIDSASSVQQYLTNTYTPFVENLIGEETTRAVSAEDRKIDKDKIVASLVSTATNDTVPGAKATYDFVNSTITSLAAYYLTKNAAGDAFATKAELNAAIASDSFFNGGAKVEPKKNDYTIVQADESHSSGSNPTTRYIFDGTNWVFQYVLNNTTFSEAQLAAINSTITETKLGNITGSISNMDSRISTITGDVSEISGSINVLSQSVSSLSGSVESVAGSIVTVSGAVSSVSGSIASLSGATSSEIGAITSQMQSIIQTLNSLTSTVHVIQTTISGLSGVYLSQFFENK